MLNDDERARIRAEEAYRQALRQELAPPVAAAAPAAEKPPESLWHKFMGFANTSFGIWLLSTVAIGGISTGYQLVAHHFELIRQNETRAHRLESELTNRFDQMSEKLLDGKTRAVVIDALRELDTGSVKMFDDLFEKNVLTLMGQLNELVGEKEQAAIGTAVPILRDLVLLNQGLRQAGNSGGPSDADAYSRLTAALEKLKALNFFTPVGARGKT